MAEPQAKIVACVRNVGWVMDSLERLYQSNPYENTKLFTNDAERNTVLTRVDTLGQRTRLVGSAWAGLKEAFYGEHGASMMVIDYDILAQRPVETVGLIYAFLGGDRYPHDVDDLAFAAPDYDDTAAAVTFENRQTVLPPDLFEQYSRLSFWRPRRKSVQRPAGGRTGIGRRACGTGQVGGMTVGAIAICPPILLSGMVSMREPAGSYTNTWPGSPSRTM